MLSIPEKCHTDLSTSTIICTKVQLSESEINVEKMNRYQNSEHSLLLAVVCCQNQEMAWGYRATLNYINSVENEKSSASVFVITLSVVCCKKWKHDKD